MNHKYFVEFFVSEYDPQGKWATFHGFYDSLEDATNAAERTLVGGTRYRVVRYYPELAAETVAGE